jgi:xanthine dehydrogenase accessory factor
MKSIYSVIPEIAEGTRFAVSTLIETEGSTPQKAGSVAVFTRSGLLAGTIGGGVLEGRVNKLSIESIESGKSGIYHFDLDFDISHTQDAICGGKAKVLIEIFTATKGSAFEELKQSLRERQPGVLVTIVENLEEGFIHSKRYWITSTSKNDLPADFNLLLEKDVHKLLSLHKKGRFEAKLISAAEEKGQVRILFESIFPDPKLIIAGAGHIGKALAHLASRLEFEVIVIDDRLEFANKQNIPEADQVVVNDIGLALENIDKQSDIYIVIVTRGHNDDAKALKACINSDARYIGMIGSRTKIEQMHQSFIKNGWTTETRWSAIHSPIGLEIRSETVEEIAVSIAAQLVMVKNSG